MRADGSTFAAGRSSRIPPEASANSFGSGAEAYELRGAEAARSADADRGDLDRRSGRIVEAAVGGRPVGEPDCWRTRRHYPQRRHRQGAPPRPVGSREGAVVLGAAATQATHHLADVPPVAPDG